MAQFAGGLEFNTSRPVRLDAPPVTMTARPLRLTLKRKPGLAVGQAVEPGTLLNPSTEHDPVGVISPLAGRVTQVLPWRWGGRRWFDVTIEPAEKQSATSLERRPPRGREVSEWLAAMAACGPWPEYGLGERWDLLEQLAAVRRSKPPVMVICVGLDALSAYPDRSTLLRSFPDDAALGVKVLAELCNARRGKLVADARLPGLRRLRRRCRDFGIHFAGVANVYPAADPTLIVAEHAPRRLASAGLPNGANPVSRRVVLTTPWTVIRLARWVTRGQVDLVRPMVVGWSTVGEPVSPNWTWPGQRLSTLAPALAGKAADLRGRAVVGHPMTGRSIVTPVGPDGPLPPTVPTHEQLVCLVTQPLPPRPEPCIHCGWCAEVCPTRLRPIHLAQLAERGERGERLTGPLQWCIDCGLCTHVCPTHLPLAQTLREAKARLAERSGGGPSD
ncbi:MAG: 4Fe-4S dicluster domain-containing protein [Phycisphaeraceae bacterium]